MAQPDSRRVVSPAERGQRIRAPQSRENDPLVQMNVRVPRSMLTQLDQRRGMFELTRDEFVRRVIEWALFQPPGTPVRPVAGRRTRLPGRGTH